MSRLTFTWTAVGSLLLAIPGAVWAQGPGASTTASNVPVLSSGQMPSSTPTSNEPLTNAFKLSLRGETYFDDNATMNKTPREWDLRYSFFPDFQFNETRPRFEWGVDYAPGVTISEHVLYRNQFTQTLNGHLAWLLSPHGLLTAQEYYLVSTDPFAQLGGATSSPGPIISPNQGIYIPNIRRTTTLTHALYSHQFSEHTSFGIGGDFTDTKFDDTPKVGPTTSLIDSQMASGEAYLSHQFSARNSVGVQYGIQVLKFPRYDARTTTHTILIFDQINISPNSSFTIYGGPEYSNTFNQVELNLGFFVLTIPIRAKEWSGAGGIIYNWTGNRLGLALDFRRGVSDGGGLVGAVEMDGGNARISWRLSRSWSLVSSLSGANETLLGTQTQQSLLTYSARAGLSQQILRNLSMNWFYERLNQTGGFANFPIGNHDFAGASLTYTLEKPIGR